MEKFIGLIIVGCFLISPATVFAEEGVVIGGFGNGLGYTAQMKENLDRGTKEIIESPKQIDPSFKEQEVTKLGVPGMPVIDKGEGLLLAFVNVMDSVCRGIWRILVAPFPVAQKVQP